MIIIATIAQFNFSMLTLFPQRLPPQVVEHVQEFQTSLRGGCLQWGEGRHLLS